MLVILNIHELESRPAEPAEGAEPIHFSVFNNHPLLERIHSHRCYHHPLRRDTLLQNGARNNATCHEARASHYHDVNKYTCESDNRRSDQLFPFPFSLFPPRCFPLPPPCFPTTAPRDKHSAGEHCPYPRIHDEQCVTVIPSVRERHEPAHAVCVEEVEDRMGRHRYER